MQVTVRLYRQHDMDLISLYLIKEFHLQIQMRKALDACAKGEIFTAEIPETVTTKKSYTGYVRRIIMMHITLNDKKNEEAIRMLKSMKPGMRNSYIKAVMRNCLPHIPLSAYKRGDGILISREEFAYEPDANATNTAKELQIISRSPIQQEKNTEKIPNSDNKQNSGDCTYLGNTHKKPPSSTYYDSNKDSHNAVPESPNTDSIADIDEDEFDDILASMEAITRPK